MDFSSSDIQLLFGERFFLIEEEASKEESVPPKENSPTTIAPKVAEPTPELKASPSAEVAKEVASKPEPEAVQTPPSPPIHLLQSGVAVVWKMRPTAQFVVVLRKQEFANRDLTGLLKNQLLQAEIDPAQVGFGIISDEAKTIDLSSAEKPYILLFDRMGEEWPQQVQIADKKVWPLPSLQQCQSENSATSQVLEAMVAIKNLLN